MFREYNKIFLPLDKEKYLARVDYNYRETFKNLIDYSTNNERFENIYDGWIDNLDDELVILEVYSVILSTRRILEQFCVDEKTYKEFIQNKRSMLFSLLKNEQYNDASTLLHVGMFSKKFKEKKLNELRKQILEYLTRKRIKLPKKIIIEIYKWADSHKLPSYLTTDIEGNFKFTITFDDLEITDLKKDLKAELEFSKLENIVDNLVYKHRVK